MEHVQISETINKYNNNHFGQVIRLFNMRYSQVMTPSAHKQGHLCAHHLRGSMHDPPVEGRSHTSGGLSSPPKLSTGRNLYISEPPANHCHPLWLHRFHQPKHRASLSEAEDQHRQRWQESCHQMSLLALSRDSG